jgi:hypothetical protein
MDSDDEEGLEIKGHGDKNEENDEEGNNNNSKKKYALQLFRPREEDKKKLLSKDPKAKQIAIECGMNAAKVNDLIYLIINL